MWTLKICECVCAFVRVHACVCETTSGCLINSTSRRPANQTCPMCAGACVPSTVYKCNNHICRVRVGLYVDAILTGWWCMMCWWWCASECESTGQWMRACVADALFVRRFVFEPLFHRTTNMFDCEFRARTTEKNVVLIPQLTFVCNFVFT